jgi:hypothetical protein
MSRCPAFTKNGKKCRSKTLSINNLFCCKDHIPFNKEIIENGCFMCMDIIKDAKDLIYFKCKHAFHRECYTEWLKYSTYEEPICIICRNIIFKSIDQNIYTKNNIKNLQPENKEKLMKISEILSDKISYYLPMTQPHSPSHSPLHSPPHSPPHSPLHSPPHSPPHSPSNSPPYSPYTIKKTSTMIINTNW